MFIAALFVITKFGMRADQMSFNRRINKLWYIYSMEYYAVIKKN